MNCRKPFMQNGAAFGCGQCLPCRINRRRLWSHRIMLEARKWSENSFVTLTYSEEFVPVLEGSVTTITTLRLQDVQKFLKRLRWNLRPARIRFFLVGEYGDESWRPHYHIALFGYKGCDYVDSRFSPSQPCKCASCLMLRVTWGKGLIHQGCIELKSSQYLAGYTVKRMTDGEDSRLQGRFPEFARMSLRPGIGASAIGDVAQTYRDYELDTSRDVTAALQHGKRLLPIGRYLRRRLRKELGLDENAPLVTLEAAKALLHPLREIAEALSDPKVFVKGTYSHEILRDLIIENAEGKYIQLVAREKLFNRGKK